MPLGIQLKDECKHDELLSILKELQQLSPHSSILHEHNETGDILHSVLLGGDQLSSSMARRVTSGRVNSTDSIQSLKGVLPVCEDWHTKLCYLTVSNSTQK